MEYMDIERNFSKIKTKVYKLEKIKRRKVIDNQSIIGATIDVKEDSSQIKILPKKGETI